MSIDREGVRLHRAVLRLAVGCVLVVGLASSGVSLAQPLPLPLALRDPEDQLLKTIPAPCGQPAANRLRLEDRFRGILLSWVADGSGADELDRSWQRAVNAAAEFVVTDENVEHLWATRSGSIIVPGIGCQESAEESVLQAVVDRGPEVVPVLFGFYLQVYQLQITPPASRRWLASRSRDRLFWLIARYKQLGGGGAVNRSERGRLLLMLADSMQLTQYQSEMLEARRLADRVVDLDPESIAARYMAATLAEREGEYEAAERRLTQLAKRLPNDAEVALRLAINRVRTGKTKTALAGLQGVARAGGPDWVRILAYQEWVRMAGEGRGEEAGPILAEALEMFPGEPQLSLQLAALLIKDGRWREAEDVLAADWVERSSVEEESPRQHYDRPRRDELEVEVGRLNRQIEGELAKLGRLLGG